MTRALSFGIALLLVTLPYRTYACGCFTPPDPTVPVVQAGERILFAVQNGQVTAHVQVQYTGSGSGSDFGWLLPLPAVPTLELGIDEVFTQLTTATQPKYRMTTTQEPSCFRAFGGTGGGSGAGGGFAAGGGSAGSADAGSSGPLVVEDSIGPYDYAVLRADSKDAMLTWLADNHYFVPTGTDQGVAPYINPGSFFLALKLKPGKTAGDLQPVVLHYASDVGMIPLTLTATGATRDMPVQVWMLGHGRAIPRNYHHTVLNDAVIDWRSAGSNYRDVIVRAAGEAPGKHTFVTEYAGGSSVMKNTLAPQSRFGLESELAAQPDAAAFLDYLFLHGFAAQNPLNPFGLPGLPATVKAVLATYLPPPAGVQPDLYYRYFRSYSGQGTVNYQPVMMANELFTRFVAPMRAAQALFDDMPTLTRLFTTLSPEDMNRDPAFSFNPDLPNVANVHQAELHVWCDERGVDQVAVLTTEQKWQVTYLGSRSAPPVVDPRSLPASLRIEILSDEGPPGIVLDNTVKVSTTLPLVVLPTAPRPPATLPPSDPSNPGARGCSVTGGALALLAVAALIRRRKQR